MRVVIISFLLFSSMLSFAQVKIDTLKIEAILNRPTVDKSLLNEDIINSIKAIDRKFIEITDTLYKFKTKNHTFFQNIPIEIKYLKPTASAFKIINSYSKKNYTLATFKNDTIKFLINELGLEYRNPYPDFLFPIDSMKINPPGEIENINTKHIHFNHNILNKKIITIAKKLNVDKKKELFDYLQRNFSYFSEDENIVYPTTIRIRYICLSDKNAYVGIDIYGAHFLWTISKKKNWDVVATEQLWVY